MPKVLILYYSKSGNTREMAELVVEGAMREKNIQVKVKSVEKAQIEDLLDADGVVIGSPTYYGSMAAEIKKFIDDSVELHGELEGKIGGAFASSGGIGGGNETTILDILKALLIHGMVIQGASEGGHYGPVAIGKPDARSKKECIAYGQRIAKLVLKNR